MESWLTCSFSGSHGPCGLQFNGDDEGSEGFKLCALHVDRMPKARDRTLSLKKRRARFVKRLFSEPREPRLLLRDIAFPEDVELPEQIAVPVEFVQCEFKRANPIPGAAKARSLTFTDTTHLQEFSLQGLDVEGSITISGCHSKKNRIALVNLRVSESLELLSPRDTNSFSLEGVRIGGNLNVYYAGASYVGIAITNTSVADTAILKQISAKRLTLAAFRCGALNLNRAQLVQLHVKGDVEVGSIDLAYATISKNGLIQGLKVLQDSSLDDLTLTEGASFSECRFLGNFAYSNTSGGEKTLRKVEFHATTFNGLFAFKNWLFSDTMDFTGATFHSAPVFHGCKFHQDTRFPTEDHFRDCKSEHAPAAYQALKKQMEELRARREEGMFVALEQRSQRHRKATMSGFERGTSWSYDLFTNYGQSYGRPLLFLGLLYLLGALTYAGLISGFVGTSVNWDAIAQGALMSLEHSVSPFGIWRKDAPPSDLLRATAAPWGVFKVAATIQSLVSLIFIALFLLALRWRFKRD